MYATDIDSISLAHARANVAANFPTRITVHESTPTSPLLALDALAPGLELDFSMCNPPFYASRAELAASSASKALPPTSACTGTDTEMVYADGGEAGFAARMLRESAALRARVAWYTTLFGRRASIDAFVPLLRAAGVRASSTRPPSGGWGPAQTRRRPSCARRQP